MKRERLKSLGAAPPRAGTGRQIEGEAEREMKVR